MTETSFPVVDKPLSEDEWKTIALGFGQGIIDRGGWPYLIGAKDNVNNTVTIDVDQGTGRNEAILSGFVHRIDAAKVLDVPAVTTTTTYEVGLVYDPLAHGTAGGPIVLTVWTQPADYSSGKNRLVLYKITRQPDQLLTDATVVENRQRVSPQLSVSKTTDLPNVTTMLVDTVALVRNTNEWYRLNKATDGTISWTLVSGQDPDVAAATHLASADKIAKRDSSGGLQAYVGGAGASVVNRTYIDNALGGSGWVAATPYPTGHSIARRFDSGVLRVGDGVALDDALNIRVGDGRYSRTGHTHPGSDITSRIPFEHVDGSRDAYDNIQSGTVYTVSVNSGGFLMRFSSAKKYKRNWKPWKPAPRSLTGVELWEYQRVQPDGEVNPQWEVGLLADDHTDDALRPFVQFDVDPRSGEWGVEDFQYLHWTVAQQRIHDWNTARVDALLEAVERLASAAGVDVSDLLAGLEWGEGEGTVERKPATLAEPPEEDRGPVLRELKSMRRRLDSLEDDNRSLRERLNEKES